MFKPTSVLCLLALAIASCDFSGALGLIHSRRDSRSTLVV